MEKILQKQSLPTYKEHIASQKNVLGLPHPSRANASNKKQAFQKSKSIRKQFQATSKTKQRSVKNKPKKPKEHRPCQKVNCVKKPQKKICPLYVVRRPNPIQEEQIGSHGDRPTFIRPQISDKMSDEIFTIFEATGAQAKPEVISIAQPICFKGGWKKANELFHWEMEVPNFTMFECPKVNQIQKTLPMFKGWMALLTMNGVTLVGPDMKTHVTYKIFNVIEIAECENALKHTVAFVSSTIIEVFLCEKFNYLTLKRSHYIQLNTFAISLAHALWNSDDIIIVTEKHQQQLWVFNYLKGKETKAKRLYIEPSARDGELPGNEIKKLKYVDQTLIVTSQKGHFYFYERIFREDSGLWLDHKTSKHRFLANNEQLVVEDIQVLNKKDLFLIAEGKNSIYYYKVEDNWKFLRYKCKIGYNIDLWGSNQIMTKRRLIIDVVHRMVIVADSEDIYYVHVDDFLVQKVNTWNVGLGLKQPHLLVVQREQRQPRIMFVSNSYDSRFIAWNIKF